MSQSLPEELAQQFLRNIRRKLYAGRDKLFFQEQRLLKQAIFYPARWLDDRAVRLSAGRYKEILTTILQTINRHGNLSQVRSLGRYLLHAVQEHMKHHGEDYYEVGKATRNALDDVMRGIRQSRQLGGEARAIQAGDSTVPAMAEAHRLLAMAKGGRKKAPAKAAIKAPAPSLQGDLFSTRGN